MQMDFSDHRDCMNARMAYGSPSTRKKEIREGISVAKDSYHEFVPALRALTVAVPGKERLDESDKYATVLKTRVAVYSPLCQPISSDASKRDAPLRDPEEGGTGGTQASHRGHSG